MSSASSIVELSRRKTRYHDQDVLLKAFIDCDGWTAKEVAVEVLDWRYEKYANCPKRAFDLQALGYLEELDGKVCRQTGKVAHTYRITGKGLDHLRENGLLVNAPSPFADKTAVAGDHINAIASLRNILGPSQA